MKIALVTPNLRYSANQYCAVSSVVNAWAQQLSRLGHDVDVVNHNHPENIRQINAIKYDFVNLHCEEHTHWYAEHINKPLYATPHYGFFHHKEKWAGYYEYIIPSILDKTTGVVALSNNVKTDLLNLGYKGKIQVVCNGANDNFQQVLTTNGRAICLGKIDKEDRKGHIRLAKHNQFKVPIDFVGPCENAEFLKVVKDHPYCKYLGAWSKLDLSDKLSSYNTLVLMSDGELAPLVVPEALVAGLSVVCSESASANLSRSKEFIDVLPDNSFEEYTYGRIASQINNNPMHRPEIQKYAKHFNWNSIAVELEEAIKELVGG